MGKGGALRTTNFKENLCARYFVCFYLYHDRSIRSRGMVSLLISDILAREK